MKINFRTSGYILAVGFVCLLLAGCSTSKLDGELLVTDDGRVFELQHRLADMYLLVKVDVAELKKELARIEEKSK